MKSKKKRRHILGVGYPFFKKSSTNVTQHTGVFLLQKSNNLSSSIAALKVTGRVGMWKKCRLILEEV